MVGRFESSPAAAQQLLDSLFSDRNDMNAIVRKTPYGRDILGEVNKGLKLFKMPAQTLFIHGLFAKFLPIEPKKPDFNIEVETSVEVLKHLSPEAEVLLNLDIFAKEYLDTIKSVFSHSDRSTDSILKLIDIGKIFAPFLFLNEKKFLQIIATWRNFSKHLPNNSKTKIFIHTEIKEMFGVAEQSGLRIEDARIKYGGKRVKAKDLDFYYQVRDLFNSGLKPREIAAELASESKRVHTALAYLYSHKEI